MNVAESVQPVAAFGLGLFSVTGGFITSPNVGLIASAIVMVGASVASAIVAVGAARAKTYREAKANELEAFKSAEHAKVEAFKESEIAKIEVEELREKRLGPTVSRKMDVVVQKLDEAKANQKEILEKVSAKPRVLVVDDDQHAADTLARFLEINGYQSEAAYCLQDVRTKLVADLKFLLLDVFLPDGRGIDFLKQEIRGRRLDILVFIITGYPGEHIIAEADAAMADHVMGKPLDLDELLNEMKRRLDSAPRPHASDIHRVIASISGDNITTVKPIEG